MADSQHEEALMDYEEASPGRLVEQWGVWSRRGDFMGTFGIEPDAQRLADMYGGHIRRREVCYGEWS